MGRAGGHPPKYLNFWRDAVIGSLMCKYLSLNSVVKAKSSLCMCISMKKKLSTTPEAIAFHKYYTNHRAIGWRSTLTFGPPELVEAVKAFVKRYKRKHGLYEKR